MLHNIFYLSVPFPAKREGRACMNDDNIVEWEYFDAFDFFKYSTEPKRKELGCNFGPISRIYCDLEPSENFESFSLYQVKSKCKERCKFKYNPRNGLIEFITKYFNCKHAAISQINSPIDFKVELPQLSYYNTYLQPNTDSLLLDCKIFRPIMQFNFFDHQIPNSSFNLFQMYDFPISLRNSLIQQENNFHFDYKKVNYEFRLEDAQQKTKKEEFANAMIKNKAEYNLDEFIKIVKPTHSNHLNKAQAKVENYSTRIEKVHSTNTFINSGEKQKITFAIAAGTILKELFIFHLIEISSLKLPSNLTILYGRKCSFLIINEVETFSIDQMLAIYRKYLYWKSKKSIIIFYDSTYQLSNLYYELLLRYKIIILLARNSISLVEYLKNYSELDKFYYWNDQLKYESSLNILPFLNPIITKYFIKKYSLEDNPLKVVEMKSSLLIDGDLFNEQQKSLIMQYFASN